MIKKFFIIIALAYLSVSSFGQGVSSEQASDMNSKHGILYEDLDTLTKVYLDYNYTTEEKALIFNNHEKLWGLNYLCTESYEILDDPDDYSLEQYLNLKLEKLSIRRLYNESVEVYDEDSGLNLRLYSQKKVSESLGVLPSKERINNQ